MDIPPPSALWISDDAVHISWRFPGANARWISTHYLRVLFTYSLTESNLVPTIVTGILNRINSFLDLQCRLNTNARLHLGFIHLDLIIFYVFVGVFVNLHNIWYRLWFRRRRLTSFSGRKSVGLFSLFLPLMAFLNVFNSNFT